MIIARCGNAGVLYRRSFGSFLYAGNAFTARSVTKNTGRFDDCYVLELEERKMSYTFRPVGFPESFWKRSPNQWNVAYGTEKEAVEAALRAIDEATDGMDAEDVDEMKNSDDVIVIVAKVKQSSIHVYGTDILDVIRDRNMEDECIEENYADGFFEVFDEEEETTKYAKQLAELGRDVTNAILLWERRHGYTKRLVVSDDEKDRVACSYREIVERSKQLEELERIARKMTGEDEVQ